MHHHTHKPHPHHIRLLLTALTATTILATTITTAHAGRLSVSNQQFRAVFARLEFGNTALESRVRCPITVEGSFHGRTIPKQQGLLVGYITRAAVNNPVCTGGHATILQELLPWHVTYNSFEGTLPNISGITFNIIRDGFIVEPGGNNCRTLSTIASPGRGIVIIGAGGRIEGLRADERTLIALTNGPGGFLCSFANGFFNGTGTVTLLGTNNSITITLI